MIQTLQLFTQSNEQANGDIYAAGQQWIPSVYHQQDPVEYGSILVNATSYSSLNAKLVLDGGTSAQTVSITGFTEIPVNSARCRSVRVHFDGKDSQVNDFRLFVRKPIPVADSPVEVTYPLRNRILRLQEPGRIRCAQLYGSDNLSANVTVGGVAHNGKTPDSGLFAISYAASPSSEISLDVQVTAGVLDSIVLYPERIERIEDGIDIECSGPAAPWRYTLYRFPRQGKLRSAAVEGGGNDVSIVMDTGTWSHTASDAYEHELATYDGNNDIATEPGWCETFRIVPGTGATRVRLAAEQRIDAEGGVVSVNNPPMVRNAVAYFAEPTQPGVLRLSSDAVATVKLYENTTLRHTENVSSDERIFLPLTLPLAQEWRVDIDCAGQVESWSIVGRSNVKAEGPIEFSPPDMGGIAMLGTRTFYYAQPTKIRSFQIFADTYPAGVTLYNGSTAHFLAAQDAQEHTVAGNLYTNDDFDTLHGTQDTVIEGRHFTLWSKPSQDIRLAVVFPQEIVPIQNEGILMRDAERRIGWKNRTLMFPEKGSISVVRVLASSYPVTIKLNGIAYDDIADGEDVALPAMLNAHTFDLELGCAGQIREVALFGERVHSADEPRLELLRDSEPFTWLGHQIRFKPHRNFACMRIDATAYPVAVEITDERGTFTVNATSDSPVRLPRRTWAREWRVDAVPNLTTTRIESIAMATAMEHLL